MAFCNKCGAEMAEGTKFCAACGADQAAPAAAPDAKDAADNKLMAVLAYIGILFLIPLLAAKESKFARFHTNQGLLLFLLGIAGSIVAVIPILGWILTVVVSVASTVFMIMGIINACKGETKELPIIGKISLLK